MSHSKNGKTEVGNGALLNSGSNRSKSNKSCYEINKNEYCGLKTRFGINPEDLLYELENNLRETCEKYNLLFIKKNYIWTLDKQNNSLSKYNGQYKNFPAKLQADLDDPIVAVVLIGCFSGIYYASDYIIEAGITELNSLYYKVKESLGYEVEKKDTSFSTSQKIIKALLATSVTICATLLISKKLKK